MSSALASQNNDTGVRFMESVTRPSRWTFFVPAVAIIGLVTANEVGASDKVRIGVVLPKAQLGQGSTGADVAEPVRQSLIAYLSGPATELVPLTARIPMQIEAEAAQAGVQYVLYTSVVHKKGRSGGFGKLLGAVAPVAGSVIPAAGGFGNTGAIVATQAATAASIAVAQQQAQQQATAALMSASQSNVRKGDLIELEYKLTRAGAQFATKLANGKATEDGQDLLSPLLEQAATEVLTSVTQ